MDSLSIVEMAEMSLKNNIVRHGQKAYDMAQKRFEWLLLLAEGV